MSNSSPPDTCRRMDIGMPPDSSSRVETAEITVRTTAPGEPVVVSASDRLAAWIGRRADELRGVRLADLTGDAVPGLIPAVKDAVQGMTAPPLQMRFTSPEGRDYEVRITVYRPERLSSAGLDDMVVIRFAREARHEQGSILPFSAFHGIIGRSPGMLALFRKIQSLGPAEASVIITGETGTGKELVARALHAESPRKAGPFEAVNCTAISEDLLESELFGHERGSFTGAIRTHKGRFERAHNGTLFLDEIGDMPPKTQSKLLRVLQDSRVERVGSERSVRVDVRVIAATNLPLETLVGSQKFRADLYHRLSVLRIHLPPLREREGDLEFLITNFLDEFSRKYGSGVTRLTPGAMELLRGYSWPGNVRELRNVIERVFIENQTDVIGRRAFDDWVVEREALSPGSWNLSALEEKRAARQPIIIPPASSRPPLLVGPGHYPLPDSAEAELQHVPREVSREDLIEAFAKSQGNIAEASRSLGVHKATFYRRMKAFNLSREELEALTS